MTIFFFWKEGTGGLVLHVDKAVGARSGHDRETENVVKCYVTAGKRVPTLSLFLPLFIQSSLPSNAFGTCCQARVASMCY